MVLSSLVRPNNIIANLRSHDRLGALRELASNLARQGDLEENAVFEMLLSREEEGSTGVGGGLAIPHCFVSGIAHPIVCVARSLAGIEFGGFDGRPARYFVGLVSPVHRPRTHARLVAGVANLFHTPYFKHDLFGATTREEILQVISGAEARPDQGPARAA
jgi:mannitol/fructose-specific phosphotransferase system IIA component (Ntr-type)